MVAGEMNPVLRHQELRSLQWPQRTREAVTQIDDGVDAAAADVLDHRFERGKISMNVRDDGDAHALILSGVPKGANGILGRVQYLRPRPDRACARWDKTPT